MLLKTLTSPGAFRVNNKRDCQITGKFGSFFGTYILKVNTILSSEYSAAIQIQIPEMYLFLSSMIFVSTAIF